MSQAGTSKTRIEAFSDGIIAIVITLLVLQIKMPTLPPGHNDIELLYSLLNLAPKLVAYIVSFLILVVWWVGHHQFFISLEKVNRNLLWINSFFLMWLCLIPFPTALIGEYPNSSVATCFYGAVSTLAALNFLWMRWYASFKAKLLKKEIPDKAIRASFYKSLVAPTANIIGMIVSLYSPHIAILIYGLTAIYFMIPSKIDIFHRNK